MYQCISDRFDLGRGVYNTIDDFLQYCDFRLGHRPALTPQVEDADAYYDTMGFVLVKIREGDNVQTLG